MKSIIAFALCIACATLAQSNYVNNYPVYPGGLRYRDPYVYNGLGSEASKYKLPHVAPYLQSASCGGCGSCSACKGLYKPGCGGCGTCSSCKNAVQYSCGGCGACAACRGEHVPHCGGCGSCSACKNLHYPVVYHNY
uniref:Uncharacterized protein n=1 Tax=Anopheles atroparvus TaxID=41427 RepID=A0A182IZ88_ANOAO